MIEVYWKNYKFFLYVTSPPKSIGIIDDKGLCKKEIVDCERAIEIIVHINSDDDNTPSQYLFFTKWIAEK